MATQIETKSAAPAAKAATAPTDTLRALTPADARMARMLIGAGIMEGLARANRQGK